jgi:heme/copper-type cytochrome/quinol oxidase subunit 2
MKSSRKFFKTIFTAAALAVSAPSSLFACAACYGKSDSPLATALNWGIFTLLGVVLTVLTCIAVFFVHIVRKESDSVNANPPSEEIKS